MGSANQQEADERWFRGIDEDDYPEPDDCDDDRDCHRCAGDGWVECPDPIECTRRHRRFTGGGGAIQECPCGSCGGSGLAKDMTIW